MTDQERLAEHQRNMVAEVRDDELEGIIARRVADAVAALEADLARCQSVVNSLAARVVAQSEILSRTAEKGPSVRTERKTGEVVQ